MWLSSSSKLGIEGISSCSLSGVGICATIKEPSKGSCPAKQTASGKRKSGELPLSQLAAPTLAATESIHLQQDVKRNIGGKEKRACSGIKLTLIPISDHLYELLYFSLYNGENADDILKGWLLGKLNSLAPLVGPGPTVRPQYPLAFLPWWPRGWFLTACKSMPFS